MRSPIKRAEEGNLDHYIKYLEEHSKDKANPYASLFLGQKNASAPENTFIQAGNFINLSELDK